MAMALASKTDKKGTGGKFATRVPDYIYGMHKAAKEVSAMGVKQGCNVQGNPKPNKK